MTDVIEAGEKRGRGAPPGPRGPRTWKLKATQREKIMGASLQEAIKAETGHDVDLEVIRAVRFTLPKWLKSDEFKEKKDNLQQFLEQQQILLVGIGQVGAHLLPAPRPQEHNLEETGDGGKAGVLQQRW